MKPKLARDSADRLLDDDNLQQVVGLLIEAARPRRIILIGSHARGEQKSDSDLDLVVIEEGRSLA